MVNNQVTLIGRVGKEPFVSEDRKFMAFPLATNERYTEYDKEGNVSGYGYTATQWHNIIVFRETLIDAGDVLVKKGGLIKIEGSIQYKNVEDSNEFAVKTSIIARSIGVIG